MKTNELFQGLEEARKDFNEWQGKTRIYVDFEDMTAWCKHFAGCNDEIRYHSPTIVPIYGKDDFYGRDDKVSQKALEKIAIEALEEYGRIGN